MCRGRDPTGRRALGSPRPSRSSTSALEDAIPWPSSSSASETPIQRALAAQHVPPAPLAPRSSPRCAAPPPRRPAPRHPARRRRACSPASSGSIGRRRTPRGRRMRSRSSRRVSHSFAVGASGGSRPEAGQHRPAPGQSTGRRLSGSTSARTRARRPGRCRGSRARSASARASRARSGRPSVATRATNGSKSSRNGRCGVQRAQKLLDRLPPSRRRARPSWCCAWPRAAPSPCRLDPLELDRPGADERLKQEVALEVVGGAVVAQRLGELQPAPHVLAPTPRASGQRGDPRPHVGRALGVVGVGGQHPLREALARARHAGVKAATEIPKRPGSPPTSYSATSRA